MQCFQTALRNLNPDGGLAPGAAHQYSGMEEFKDSLLKHCSVHTPTVVYNRELYDEGHVYWVADKYLGAADYDMYCSFADKGIYIHTFYTWLGYVYRVHEAQSTWGRCVSGLQYYGIQELTSNIYSQHAAVLKRHWGELEGFKAAGGEEAYYQQQAERKAQAPAKQRAAMRGAEQLRLRSRSASSFLGGGAGPSPARTAQRSAERERLTARGETSTSGGGVARRRARRGGSYLLQPTGGAREILG